MKQFVFVLLVLLFFFFFFFDEVYIRKHTHNKNEKATEIMLCECNEN